MRIDSDRGELEGDERREVAREGEIAINLLDAIMFVKGKADRAANYLEHDQLFPEELAILQRYIPSSKASEL